MSWESLKHRQGSRHGRVQESVYASRIGGRLADPWQGTAEELDSSYARRRRNDIKAVTGYERSRREDGDRIERSGEDRTALEERKNVGRER
jgi:hypothetical protein